MPRTGKTSAEVVEIVPCARNKWGNWWDFWFYVSYGEVEDLSGLPPAILCSHCYVVFPRFEVAEDDEDEGALRYAARMSSGRDLVEEFIGYGLWPLAHGWVLGKVCPTGCRPWAISWCKVHPSLWIYGAGTRPRLCAKWRPRPQGL
jgi:hypothetical protein